jgi:hypothetical protein
MSNRENRRYGKLFPERDYYYKLLIFGEYEEDDIAEEYPAFFLRIVHLFGFLPFNIFLAAQRIYPCGGGEKISREKHIKRTTTLAAFSLTISVLLIMTGYCGLSLILCHDPYKNVSQAFLLILLFLFFVGTSGMTKLLGLQSAYGKDGFLKRSPSPVDIMLNHRRARKNWPKQIKRRKR